MPYKDLDANQYFSNLDDYVQCREREKQENSPPKLSVLFPIPAMSIMHNNLPSRGTQQSILKHSCSRMMKKEIELGEIFQIPIQVRGISVLRL